MLLDTSAWIEFFQGTEKGKHVEEIIKNEDNFTANIIFAELIEWCMKNKKEDEIRDYIEGIKKGSQIIDLGEDIITLAGKLNHERKKAIKNWGMMDSFILAAAQIYNLKILTKDNHFRDLPNVEII